MPSDLQQGEVVAGFRVESLIGRGAVGSIYLADEPQRGGRVALKVLAAEIGEDERFRRRFLRESELASHLEHPHIVPTFGSGEEGGRLYLAMAYIEGSDLRDLLRDEGRLEPERALELLGQVADALDAAHAAGLVHRDVKPGNILIAPGDDGEHAYVCDFGLARHVSSAGSLTGDRGFVGTVDYIPPEQIRGGPVDGRADVYSLGCVLFQCLAGARPFERESELATVFAHLNEPPPRLSDFTPELPRAYDDVFAAALAKSPDDRYASCGELVRAAAAALRGKAALPRTRSRRRRFLLAGAAAGVAVAAAVAVIATTRDDPPRPPVGISQTSIAGASLGRTEAAYKKLYGAGWRADVFTAPNFPVLIFQHRNESVYFDPDTRRGIVITTWNRNDRTAAGVGPCSSLEELKSAYGATLKPSRWNTQEGKVYAYTVGKNLLFAMNGPPPNPSKHVTAVALYDGDGPTDDGAGVDVRNGTLPFAGFVALSESTCD